MHSWRRLRWESCKRPSRLKLSGKDNATSSRLVCAGWKHAQMVQALGLFHGKNFTKFPNRLYSKIPLKWSRIGLKFLVEALLQKRASVSTDRAGLLRLLWNKNSSQLHPYFRGILLYWSNLNCFLLIITTKHFCRLGVICSLSLQLIYLLFATRKYRNTM